MALALAAPAAAEEPTPEQQAPTKRSVEILEHIDEDLEAKPSPFTRLGLNTRLGLTYRHSLELGGRRFHFRLNGPVQKRKTFGLKIKVEF